MATKRKVKKKAAPRKAKKAAKKKAAPKKAKKAVKRKAAKKAKKKVVKKAAKKKAAPKKAKKKAAKKAKKKVAKKAKKKVVKKAAKKKAAPKKAKKKTKRKPNAAFMKPLEPSAELAAIIGKKSLPRTQAVKKLWVYIKKNKLQDDSNKRMINCDEKMTCLCKNCPKRVLKKGQVNMLQLGSVLASNLK